MDALARRTVYCTIVARNYLAQAMCLRDSVLRHDARVDFRVLIIDASPADRELDFSDSLDSLFTEGEIHDLASIYDVVELSTAVKPRYLSHLIRSGYEHAVYLDPDTYLTSALLELPTLIEKHGVVLTPHLIDPVSMDGGQRSAEAANLTVGMHNLGFVAVGSTSLDFLQWWWSHLERECLIYPLLGLFVDQKWLDVGAVLFRCHTLYHRGYNIGHWNLHERRFSVSSEGFSIVATGEPVRLLHFSGFNPHAPEEISSRQNVPLAGTGLAFPALDDVSRDYARHLLAHRVHYPESSEYLYGRDQSGRRLTRRTRRTYRAQLLEGRQPPSPFAPGDRSAFARWRISSTRTRVTTTLLDSALAFKYAFPDTFTRVRKLAPTVSGSIRGSLLQAGKIRR